MNTPAQVWDALRATGGSRKDAAALLGVAPNTVVHHILRAKKAGTFPQDVQVVDGVKENGQAQNWGWGKWRDVRSTPSASALDSVLIPITTRCATLGIQPHSARMFAHERRLAGAVNLVRELGGKPSLMLMPANGHLLPKGERCDPAERLCVTLTDWAAERGVTLEAAEWLAQNGHLSVWRGTKRTLIAADHPEPSERLLERADLCSRKWSASDYIRFFIPMGKSVKFIAAHTGYGYQSLHQMASRARRLGQLPERAQHKEAV